MKLSFFIAGRIRYKGVLSVTTIAVSYLVMIVAVAISSGFRHEIRKGVSEISGDVQIMPIGQGLSGEGRPVPRDASYLSEIENLDMVSEVIPTVYRTGIVRNDGVIQGAIFKGLPSDADNPLTASVPRRLADVSGLSEGDRMTVYFVGEKVKVRNFTITDIYDGMLDYEDKLVVKVPIQSLQRLNDWDSLQVSAFEVNLKLAYKDVERMRSAASDISNLIYESASDEDVTVVASSAADRFSLLFDWLDLIDFNVLFILVLMTIVAGFNMMSGLLIMLFENISVIGLFKSLGMRNLQIAKIFAVKSSSLVLKGMLSGNLIAFLFCAIQSATKVLKLNPENYFISFVPVHINPAAVLEADLVSYLVIMLILCIPSLFISKVDPAKTVNVR
ncbi:MAG: ABC transporter permease [Candidatus Cryptobacteroides sp.]